MKAIVYLLSFAAFLCSFAPDGFSQRLKKPIAASTAEKEDPEEGKVKPDDILRYFQKGNIKIDPDTMIKDQESILASFGGGDESSPSRLILKIKEKNYLYIRQLVLFSTSKDELYELSDKYFDPKSLDAVKDAQTSYETHFKAARKEMEEYAASIQALPESAKIQKLIEKKKELQQKLEEEQNAMSIEVSSGNLVFGRNKSIIIKDYEKLLKDTDAKFTPVPMSARDLKLLKHLSRALDAKGADLRTITLTYTEAGSDKVKTDSYDLQTGKITIDGKEIKAEDIKDAEDEE